ncbi:DUF2071 domain-containing protein [Silvibacterium dinghuense]|uniref:DUF2071 domain-containing protein n=2 Tax=Silvibacterium dinghuense TaxID=1560006 RepID=A0A4Q1SK99_9BACT|nr:DUF2071 domain-containing protein [Silvibacterium dinghuense]
MRDILSETGHRPWPLPSAHWSMTQRWNDLLFAHWPVPASQIAPLIPSGLTIDTFDGSAWIGVVPFWMDQIRLRGLPAIPGLNRFPELNLRTYVREPHTNLGGVYFFSLDAANPIAVTMARTFYRLPYHWAKMKIEHCDNREFLYSSERRFASGHSPARARFRARYRSLGQASDKQGLEQFLTERYALYTAGTGKPGEQDAIFKGNIHHLPWPLERAEAEFEINELPAAHGIKLPDIPPVLHYSRELFVYVWALDPLPTLVPNPAATPVPAPKPL